MKKHDNIETVPKRLWTPARGWHHYYIGYDELGGIWHIEVYNESKHSEFHWEAIRCLDGFYLHSGVCKYSRTLTEMSEILHKYGNDI